MSSLKTESKDKMATRDGFGRELVELGAEKDFVVMCADLAESTRTIWFKEKYPDRFIECGIAESNMMSIAAGIASTGKPVVTSTYAMFAAGRAYEQIRNSIAYPHFHVIIAATHAGLSVGEDGATHQCIEDIALMRAIPGMTLISPCDGIEAKKAIRAAFDIDGPVYIRLGRSATPVITGADEPFEVGKGTVLTEGKDITIFATGILVNEVLAAQAVLQEKGISAEVVNIHTIKPLDTELVVKSAAKTKRVFTVEEHSIIGGLGSAIAECLAEKCPTPITRIGVEDVFGMSGNVNELLDYYKLTAPHIVERVLKTLG